MHPKSPQLYAVLQVFSIYHDNAFDLPRCLS
jgi:hypothetical protein